MAIPRFTLAVLVIPALWGAEASATPTVKRPETPTAKSVPLGDLPERERELVAAVVEKPTLAARGVTEAFQTDPRTYRFFLDNPDRAVDAWRRLGAKCVSITARRGGGFGWCDDQGSELAWETAHQANGLRIWYAEGKVKPGPLLPAVPVKAVVVLRYNETKAANGGTIVQHQADLFVHTDSKTASLMTRMMGPSAGRVAEQGLGQLQLFFSGLCWYLERHPEEARKLLKEEK